MTNEEAHKYLEIKQREMTQNRHMYTKQAMDINGLAILALEKQMPKKVKRVNIISGLIEEIYCPVCGKYYGDKVKGNAYLFWSPEHCECGQALDWNI